MKSSSLEENKDLLTGRLTSRLKELVQNAVYNKRWKTLATSTERVRSVMSQHFGGRNKRLNLKWKTRTREVAGGEDHLLYKHEDLSLNLQYSCKRWGMATWAWKLQNWRVMTEGSWKLTGQPNYLNRKLPVPWDTLSQNNKAQNDGGRYCVLFWLLHACSRVVGMHITMFVPYQHKTHHTHSKWTSIKDLMQMKMSGPSLLVSWPTKHWKSRDGPKVLVQFQKIPEDPQKTSAFRYAILVTWKDRDTFYKNVFMDSRKSFVLKCVAKIGGIHVCDYPRNTRKGVHYWMTRGTEEVWITVIIFRHFLNSLLPPFSSFLAVEWASS